jgi:hypothetical protein
MNDLTAIARFKALAGLSEPVKRKIVSDNPRRFYAAAARVGENQ